jgi:WD40 repeat protein
MPIQRAQFNHATDRLALAAGDQVTLWQLPPGPQPTLTIACEDTARYLEFSRDDRRLAIACQSFGRVHERAAHIHDTKTGRELLPPLRHGDGVLYAGFSPNGHTILSAGEDHQARLWDATTGQLLLQLEHPDQVLSARFSPDGRWIATVCRDKQARVWDAEMGEPITPPLPQPWTAAAVWFAADSRALVAQRVSGQTVLWPLPRELRPSTELLVHARMLSGREVPHAGPIVAQSRDSLLGEWRRLRPDSVSEFSSLWDRVMDWHLYHAESSESQKLWNAAVFHWIRLTTLDPQNPSYAERLAHARARLD